MRMVTLVLGAVLLVAVPGALFVESAPQPAAQTAMTNVDVVKMVEAGLSQEIIVASVRQAPAKNFTLTPEALIELKRKGVPDPVIAAMLGSPPVAASATLATPPAAMTDPNDPMQPHPDGIYLDMGEGASPRLLQLTEASVRGRSVSGAWGSAFTGGLTRMKYNYQVRSPRSERRTTSPTPAFYAYGVEPADYALLKMKIKAKDKEREFTGMVMGFTGSRAPKGDVEIVTEKVAEGIYRLKPAVPLQPGEYCFAYATQGVALAALDFGVDPPAPVAPRQ